eukprot:TRINITY_DN40342_c0_g1_i1.p1 TRINITY_DN40342_c0_g1~~TRINITY_DN40342_c0_g1_i1.p1  ORF type:complete len:1783 (+),score=246.39 TRINITY_DN40342_c0_g1_i1:177-5525(+)
MATLRSDIEGLAATAHRNAEFMEKPCAQIVATLLTSRLESPSPHSFQDDPKFCCRWRTSLVVTTVSVVAASVTIVIAATATHDSVVDVRMDVARLNRDRSPDVFSADFDVDVHRGASAADLATSMSVGVGQPRQLGSSAFASIANLVGDAELCPGSQEDLSPCNVEPCGRENKTEDCVWDAWSNWQMCDCSATQKRDRASAQQAKSGGLPCVGPKRQARPCTPYGCGHRPTLDCSFSLWALWSDCTRSCRGGQKYRTRDVVRQSQGGGKFCSGRLHETVTCNRVNCPGEGRVDCRWAAWSDWSICSDDCGGGQTSRSRSVEVAPRNGGKVCDAKVAAEMAQCKNDRCKGQDLDCKWTHWSDWSECSKTCGGGRRFRIRGIARESLEGGVGCTGVFEDFSGCGEAACDVPAVAARNCNFGDWSAWALCSSACNGYRSRTRMVGNSAAKGGSPCSGSTMDVAPCNQNNRECGSRNVDCIFGDWSPWSECSRSCGGGTKTRERQVAVRASDVGKQCDGDLVILRGCASTACPGHVPTDCEWSAWSDWSSCTRPCGGGNFRRHRSIVSEASDGGRPCNQGESSMIGACNPKPCSEEIFACEWSAWSSWSKCTRGGDVVSCGGGQRKRTRLSAVVREMARSDADVKAILSKSLGVGEDSSEHNIATNADRQRRATLDVREEDRDKSDHSDITCHEFQNDLEPCAQNRCAEISPVNCTWSSWSSWSSCACDNIQERHRVIAYYAVGGGAQCEGPEVQAVPCSAHCDEGPAMDCEHSPWTPWSACPVTCGGGQVLGFVVRFRTVTQYPRGSGEPCDGGTNESQPCSLAPCPKGVDCDWGQWTLWSDCSASCGGGERSRSRNIDQVARNGGRECAEGDSMFLESCNTQRCQPTVRDCELSDWSEWQMCSVTCDGGHQLRSRIVEIEPSLNGRDCNGSLQQYRTCGLASCPGQAKVDCDWGPWSQWSACSMPCAGHAERNRAIVRYSSQGGRPCMGSERSVQPCNVHSPACLADAPVDCEFSDWTEWTLCSQSCDGGQRYQSRQVKVHARNLGQPCNGPLQTSQPCNTGSCHVSRRRDCQWEHWASWSDCSKSCSGGQQTRHRGIGVEPTSDGQPCDRGAAVETAPCNVRSCQSGMQVCGWSQWGFWDPCSKSCGGGQRERFRKQRWELPKSSAELKDMQDDRRLNVNLAGGNDCAATQKGMEPCAVQPCYGAESPTACRWEEWSSWGSCSCEGLQHASRGIAEGPHNGGLFCAGPCRRSKGCLPNCGGRTSVGCRFGDWTDWTECSATCDGGQRFHTRVVAEHAEAYGTGCDGSLEGVGTCNALPCGEPVDCAFSAWSEWSHCTHTCDGGQRERSRTVRKAAEFGGASCVLAALVEVGDCKTERCQIGKAVDCRWTAWSSWSSCPLTCGQGTELRTREVGIEPAHGGTPCNGTFEQYRLCTVESCPSERIDCIFAQWSSWSSCSAHCGGNQERARSIKTFASGQGIPCSDATRQMRPCDDDTSCDEESRDCRFGDWTEWSACSRSCNGGQQFSHRQVAAQARGNGRSCGSAALRRVQPCGESACSDPVDCVWSDWGRASRCTATCGGGQHYRRREILTLARNGGKACGTTDTIEALPCATQSCSGQLVCVWTQWSSWGSCSAACSGGEMKRHRLRVNASSLLHAQSPIDGSIELSASLPTAATAGSLAQSSLRMAPLAALSARLRGVSDDSFGSVLAQSRVGTIVGASVEVLAVFFVLFASVVYVFVIGRSACSALARSTNWLIGSTTALPSSYVAVPTDDFGSGSDMAA